MFVHLSSHKIFVWRPLSPYHGQIPFINIRTIRSFPFGLCLQPLASFACQCCDSPVLPIHGWVVSPWCVTWLSLLWHPSVLCCCWSLFLKDIYSFIHKSFIISIIRSIWDERDFFECYFTLKFVGIPIFVHTKQIKGNSGVKHTYWLHMDFKYLDVHISYEGFVMSHTPDVLDSQVVGLCAGPVLWPIMTIYFQLCIKWASKKHCFKIF